MSAPPAPSRGAARPSGPRRTRSAGSLPAYKARAAAAARLAGVPRSERGGQRRRAGRRERVECRQEQNVRWKTPIPGISNASPVVWGDKVFIVTA